LRGGKGVGFRQIGERLELEGLAGEGGGDDRERVGTGDSYSREEKSSRIVRGERKRGGRSLGSPSRREKKLTMRKKEGDAICPSGEILVEYC